MQMAKTCSLSIEACESPAHLEGARNADARPRKCRVLAVVSSPGRLGDRQFQLVTGERERQLHINYRTESECDCFHPFPNSVQIVIAK